MAWRQRRTRRWVLGAIPAAVVGVAAIGPRPAVPALAQDSSADATALLNDAAVAMAKVKSFHFALTTVEGKTEILDGLEVKGIEGDVVRPDRFRAAIQASLMVATLEVKVVGIGSRLWVTDPRQADETYIALEADTGVEELLNPDRLLLEAVAVIEEAEITGTEDIDGVETTKIEGVVDIRNALERAANGTPVPELDRDDENGAGLLPDGELLIAVWVDENSLVRRLALGGPLTPAEDPNVIRQLDLSAYDEPVEIAVPATA